MNNNQIHTIEVKRMGFYLKGTKGSLGASYPQDLCPGGLTKLREAIGGAEGLEMKRRSQRQGRGSD